MSKGVFRRPRLLSTIVSTAVLAVMIQPSHAAKINMSGFATFGMGMADLDEQLSSFSIPVQPTVEGLDDNLNFNELSKSGLQFNTKVNKKLSATMQLTGQGISQFSGKISWAYATFNINQNFMVQAGRMRSPIFMKSQSLDVGYSYDWVAPPREVYGLVRIDDFNGANISFKKYTKNFNITAGVFGGGTTVDLLIGGQVSTFDMRNALGAEVKGSIMRKLKFRASYVSAEFSTPRVAEYSLGSVHESELASSGAAGQGIYNALFNGTAGTLYAGGPDGGLCTVLTGGACTGNMERSRITSAAILAADTKFINDINLLDSKGTFLGFGLDYSIANINLIGEYVYRTLDDASIIPETGAWYVGASYKYNKFIPYVYYTAQQTEDNDRRTGYSSATFDSTMGGLFDSKSEAWALGLRYNILPKTAIKAEWKQTKAKDGTSGMLSTVPSGNNDDTTNLYRVTLDILF